MKSLFKRYIGIDYSGAQTPSASLKGLRAFCATGSDAPTEILPPPGLKKYWTRQGLAQWLLGALNEDMPTLVGIDHGFSFPLQYFEEYRVPRSWTAFLDDFQKYWPADKDIYVDLIRDGAVGNGSARMGSPRWRRLTELRAGSAKSVFHFDVQGSVAKSTHAGLPWLRFLRSECEKPLHFWPFDGWMPPESASMLAEVYPSLWRRYFHPRDRTPDQHDAFCVSAWLQQMDLKGDLPLFFKPALSAHERKVAEIEGWILGVI